MEPAKRRIRRHTAGMLIASLLSTSAFAEADVTLSVTGPASAPLGVTTSGYSTTLANQGDTITPENVRVEFEVQGPGPLAVGDVIGEFERPIGSGNFTPMTLAPCGANLCGDYGEAETYPLPAGYTVTMPMRSTFHRAGAHTLTMRVVGATSGDVYATDSLSGTITAPSITLGVTGPANAQRGIPTTGYSSSLANNGDGATSENVKVRFEIAGPSALEAGDVVSEYQMSPGNFAPIPLTACGANLCGDFGPVAGFPVPAGYSATTALRNTFNKAGAHSVAASVVGVTSGTVYADDTLASTVRAPDVALSLAGPATASLGVTTSGYSTTLANNGDGITPENVRVVFEVQGPGPLAVGDVIGEFERPIGSGNFTPMTLAPCGANLCGDYGEAETYPLPAGYTVTMPMRSTFHRAGAHTLTMRVVGATSGDVYATDSLSGTITAPSITLGVSGPATAEKGIAATGFSSTLRNVGDGATQENVKVRFVISGAQALAAGDVVSEYQVSPGVFGPIPLTVCGSNLCGDFGPFAGFPVPAGYDATTALRNTFNTAGMHTVAASVIGATSGDEYATASSSTTVRAPDVALSLAGPATASLGVVTTGYSTTLANNGDGITPENVRVVFEVQGPGPLAVGDVVGEFERPIGSGNFTPMTLVPCGANLCGDYGEAETYLLPAGYTVTMPMRSTFHRAGAHTLTMRVVGATSGDIYATDSLSGTITAPSITLDVSGPATTDKGLATPGFSSTLTNEGDGATTENVKVRFVISGAQALAAGDVVSEYELSPGVFDPIPLTVCGSNLCGDFGPAAGFPVPAGYDATTALRNTFNTAGVHTVAASVIGVTSGDEYATASSTTTVRAPDLSLAVSGPGTADKSVATVGFSSTLTNEGDGATTENVKVRFVISGAQALAAGDVVSEYELSPGVFGPIPLTVCGSNLCGDFGPAAGFPVPAGYDATTALRNTFNTAGMHTVSASVIGVDSEDEYATASSTTTVLASDVAIALTGPATVDRGVATTGFASTLTNEGDGATIENVKVSFEIAGPSALVAGDVTSEYETVPGSGTFAPIPLVVCGSNLCGDFGPAAGFPVAAGYDATTALRNTFEKAGVHGVTVRVVGIDSGDTLASDTFSTEVVSDAATLEKVAGDAQSAPQGSAVAIAPQVRVVDAGGGPVEGAVVTFAVTAGGGSVTTASVLSDESGLAAVGSWTLGASVGVNTLTASVDSIDAVVFTATATAHADIAVTLSSTAEAVRDGVHHSHVVIVTNAGPSAAQGVSVSLPIPDQHEAATATWFCHAVAGATCAASGTGAIDETVDLPVGASVVFLTSSVVDSGDEDIVVATAFVSHDDDLQPANDTASESTPVVLFRSSFELGGNGVVNGVGGGEASTLEGEALVGFDLSALVVDGPLSPVARGVSADGDVFAIDFAHTASGRVVIVRGDAAVAPAWGQLSAQASSLVLGVAGEQGQRQLLVHGAEGDLALPLSGDAVIQVIEASRPRD